MGEFKEIDEQVIAPVSSEDKKVLEAVHETGEKVSPATLARTIFLFISTLNMVLVMIGKNPLDVDESAIYGGISMVVQLGATVWSWWKNNSFTTSAIKADDVLKIIK
jgi:holin, SPP1 family